MKSKKGMETINIVIAFIVVGILAAVLIYLIMTFVVGGGKQLGAHISTLEDPSCKLSGERKQVLGQSFLDNDGDLRPDALCDICICKSNTCDTFNTDNDVDNDADNVPADCDIDDSDSKKGFCGDEPKAEGCKAEGVCGKGGSGKIQEISEGKFQCCIGCS